MEVGSLWVKLGIDVTQFTQAIRNAQKQLESFAARSPKLDALSGQLRLAKGRV